ncbi:MAG: isocitrate/isopropylmalate family dehydrogenase [Bacteroidota bacterium]
MKHTVTLIPGDGIGPEVVEATLIALEATGVQFQWEECLEVGTAAVDAGKEPLPEDVLASIRKNKVALKGPVTTPVGKGFKSVNVQLRQKLNLHANVRPSSTLPGVNTRFSDVDLIIFRENTEGLYSGIETFDERLQIADSTARITRTGSERIIRFSFDYARAMGRKTVTLVHKANILKKSSGMFLAIGREIAQDYPDIEFNDRIIDNMCMQMVTVPERYDCIVTTNLFGDILSDLAAGLVGGLGVVAGANIGDECAVFEAVHGSAPDIAGQKKANPTALILSAEMMLRHLGEVSAAAALRKGLYDTLREGTHLTADLGGKSSTTEFAKRVADAIAEHVTI